MNIRVGALYGMPCSERWPPCVIDLEDAIPVYLMAESTGHVNPTLVPFPEGQAKPAIILLLGLLEACIEHQRAIIKCAERTS